MFFGKITQIIVLIQKIEIHQIFGACFLLLNKAISFNLKNVIFRGSRGQKVVKRAVFRPLQKKNENDMPICLIFLPGCISSDVSKKHFSSLWTHFWALSLNFTDKNCIEKRPFIEFFRKYPF